MKSLGYAYAEYMASEPLDVEQYFEDIVHGEIEIPKWFVEEWIQANPIFASENETLTGICGWCDKNAQQLREVDYGGGGFICPTCHYSYRKLGYNPHRNPHPFKRKAETFESAKLMEMNIYRTIAPEDEKDVRVKCTSCPNGYIRDIPIQPTATPMFNNAKEIMCDTCRAVFFLGRPVYHDVGSQMRFDAENSEDYEVIMTNIGHTMERDGETIVFGDVMFATPNDGRSRISSYGQGADKASARQALIDNARGYLIETGSRREDFNAEGIEEYEAQARQNFNRNCRGKGWSLLGRTMHYDCSVFGKVVGGGVVVSNSLDFYDKGSRKLRTAGVNKDFAPAVELAEVSRELQPNTMEDWSRVAQVTNDRLSQNFSAETKSWRIQNRDSSGKFTKGFVTEIDIADFMELDPDFIPEISVSVTHTPEQTIEFVNSMINDDDLPMRLMDSNFVNTLQSHVSSADPEMLEGLFAAAKLGFLEATISSDPDQMFGAKRAVFVTELLLNYKWGQDYWSAESEQ
jgi:hypothetical protein